MGLFTRLHRVTIARIESFFDRVEDPEVMFPQLVREMEEQLREATDAEAKAAAALKGAQRELENARERIEKLGRGAQLAVKGGDETTAREAVSAQIDAERTAASAGENVERAKKTAAHASAARKRIQQQLEELRSRKEEIITRSRVAKTRQNIQQTVSGAGGGTDSILDAVARLEAGVEEAEAELEIQAAVVGDSTVSPSLEQRLDDLDRDAEIEKRMEQLRKQVGNEQQ